MKILIVLSSLLFPFIAWSYIGSETGNGGESTAIQIKITGQAILSELKYASVKNPLEVDIEKLAKSLETVKIETTFKLLFLNGKLKDAINYPDENRIIFNSIMWRHLSTKDKKILVLHELLGLNRIDDGDYRLSIYLEKIASTTVPFALGKDKDCFSENGTMKEGQIFDIDVVNIVIVSDVYSALDRENYCSITVKDRQKTVHKFSASYTESCKRVFSEKKTDYKFRIVSNHLCEILN